MRLSEKGLWLREGTIVDATRIAVSSSTKNRDGKRDEQRRQTKKGQPWYFGMEAHVGVDARSGRVPTVIATAANVADVTQALLHGEETDVSATSEFKAWKSEKSLSALPSDGTARASAKR